MTFPVRAQPFVIQIRRGRLPAGSRRHALVDGLERQSGRNAPPSGITPSTITVAGPEPTRVADRGKAGRPRAQTHTTNRAHAPPNLTRSTTPTTPDPALDAGPPHK
jgi:hypothetical protein